MIFDYKKAFIVLCAVPLLMLTACGEKSSDASSASQPSEPTVSSIEATDHSSTLPAAAAAESESPTTVQSINGHDSMTAPPRVEESPPCGDSQSAVSSSSGSAQSSSKQNDPAKSSSAQSSSESAKSNEKTAGSGSSEPEQAYNGDNAEVNINEFD